MVNAAEKGKGGVLVRGHVRRDIAGNVIGLALTLAAALALALALAVALAWVGRGRGQYKDDDDSNNDDGKGVLHLQEIGTTVELVALHARVEFCGRPHR